MFFQPRRPATVPPGSAFGDSRTPACSRWGSGLMRARLGVLRDGLPNSGRAKRVSPLGLGWGLDFCLLQALGMVALFRAIKGQETHDPLCLHARHLRPRHLHARAAPHPSASIRGESLRLTAHARELQGGREPCACRQLGRFGGTPSRPLVLPPGEASDARLDAYPPVTLSAEATRQASQHKSMFLFIL
jgi:hypothetical protein